MENTIISADSHVFEPVNLWETRIDRKFRERGPRFVADYQGKPGTYGTGNTKSSKIDYLLLSPALWPKLTAVGVERGGVYAPRGGNPFPSVTSKATQASDHGAVYADLDL